MLSSAHEPTSSSKSYLLLLLTAGVVVIADQITKSLALEALSDGHIDLIDGILALRLTFNPGGAFGLLQGFPELFLLASGVVVIAILLWARRADEPRLLVPLGLVLGGGVGNLTDRLVRDHDGQVVDFIDLHVWPVFNLADSAIVIGVLLVLLSGASQKWDPEPAP